MTKKIEAKKPRTPPMTNLKKLHVIACCKAGEGVDVLASRCGVTEQTVREWLDQEADIRETLGGDLRSQGWYGVGDEFRSLLTGTFVRGDGWEDVGDEWPAPMRSLYEQAVFSLETPDKFVDRKFAGKYAKWLKGRNKKALVVLALELGLQPTDVFSEEFSARFDSWLQPLESETPGKADTPTKSARKLKKRDA